LPSVFLYAPRKGYVRQGVAGAAVSCFIDRNRTTLSTLLDKIRIFVAKTRFSVLRPFSSVNIPFRKQILA
jgi:hypothetical protein